MCLISACIFLGELTSVAICPIQDSSHAYIYSLTAPPPQKETALRNTFTNSNSYMYRLGTPCFAQMVAPTDLVQGSTTHQL